jgi:hypothetical protein
MYVMLMAFLSVTKNQFQAVQGSFTLSRIEVCRGISGTEGAAGSQKTVHNRKADCFTAIRRITRLKM